jgi:hypothetical protein
MITIDQFKKICREILGEINCSFSENKLREDALEDFTRVIICEAAIDGYDYNQRAVAELIVYDNGTSITRVYDVDSPIPYPSENVFKFKSDLKKYTHAELHGAQAVSTYVKKIKKDKIFRDPRNIAKLVTQITENLPSEALYDIICKLTKRHELVSDIKTKR